MRELYTEICQAIQDRSTWEERQKVWYQMRHDGLRRRRKPFPGAADLHFPLIDTQIEKLKPFFYGQAFAAERLAEFVSLESALAEASETAADGFNYYMRQNTNFETELLHLVDCMLLTGRGILKQRWDPTENTIAFESIDPLYLVVAGEANDLEGADILCHVKHLSVGAYRADTGYRQSEDLVARIRGGRTDDNATSRDQEKLSREGLTESRKKNLIIVWETWSREKAGWRINTFSPAAPDEDLRAPFVCPYKRKGKPFLPMTAFRFEVKDKGWYAPRGVAERQAPFESWMCKTWNGKADAMEFYNKPLFTRGTMASANTSNLTFAPGSILPEGMAAVDMPEPPISFDQELLQTHRIAQESLSMPDANIATMESGRDNPTAREISYRQALAGQGVDMRGRIFRLSLADVYGKSWAIVVQFSGREITYYVAKERKVLPRQAMHDNYLIQPDGSSDQWHKEARFSRSVSRYQMFNGHPFIDQGELVKSVLVDDDSRLVNRLWRPPNVRAADEAEDEALEILGLMAGFPMQAKVGEDHALRIRIISGKLAQLAQVGAPLDPIARQRLQEHLAQHVQLLQQQNPALARKIQQAAAELDPQPTPDNVQPFPPMTPATRAAVGAEQQQEMAVSAP